MWGLRAEPEAQEGQGHGCQPWRGAGPAYALAVHVPYSHTVEYPEHILSIKELPSCCKDVGGLGDGDSTFSCCPVCDMLES